MPAGHMALDTSFKIIGANVEIRHLNIEVHRVATHIHNEDLFLRTQEDLVCLTDPCMVHQIKTYRNICGQFNVHHICQIRQIIWLPGYTGNSQLGIPLEAASIPANPASNNFDIIDEYASIGLTALQEKEDLVEEEEEEEQDREVNDDIYNILALSHNATYIHILEVTDI